jgi:ribonuclease HI
MSSGPPMDKGPKKVCINLNICQWNARSIKPKHREFENLLAQEKVHIIALSETWLEPDSDFTIKNYNIFRKDRDSAYGGVAILTHKSIRAKAHVGPLCTNPDIECICVKISNCSHLENFISVYCPSDVRTTQNEWDHIFSCFNRKTVILGDFNGHHSSWSYKTETRGLQIFNSILENNYAFLNTGEHTRFQLVNGDIRSSSPDLSLASLDIAATFVWSVMKESLGSDHQIIKLYTPLTMNLDLTKKRNFKRADWAAYSAEVNELLSNISVPNDPQNAYNCFVECLYKAAEKHIPIIKVCHNPENKFKPRPYWNPELSKAVARRRLALAEFRRNPTPNNLISLQERISEAQKLIRNAQGESWRTFCSNLNESTSASAVWRHMRWLKGCRSPRRSIDAERAYTLLQSLAPDCVSPPKPTWVSQNDKLEVNITVSEMEKCIKLKDTAPGCDEVSYSMIKNLPSSGKFVLTNLYNMFLNSGFVPSQWRQINIVGIPKPGRDPQSVSSFRPIAMMSCLAKIFHSILQRRLEWFFERHNFFSDNAVGFRRCRSCLDNLSQLIGNIHKGFLKNEPTVGCFIDINNAYNNVDISSLVAVLDRSGVGQKICNYLWEYLRERHLQIKVDNTQTCRYTSCGLAQGDPLSPLLFNVATMDVCNRVCDVNISQYADDFVLYCTHSNLRTATGLLQASLNSMVQLVGDMGLEISPEKSKVCIFQKGHKRFRTELRVNNNMLQVTKNVKYLGLWLDGSLRWAKHINETADKASRFLNVLKVLAGSSWGVHPKHLRRIYMAVIRSRLDYASFLFDDGANCHTNKLDIIQNQAMRVVGGFVKTTPIHVMESELFLQPLFVRRQYLGGKFWFKSKSLKFYNTTISLLNDLCDKTHLWKRKKEPLLWAVHRKFENVPVHCSDKLEMFSFDWWMNYINVSNICPNIDAATMPKREYGISSLRNMCSEFLKNKYAGFYEIYTDGSKDEDGLGAAFFDSQLNLGIGFKIEGEISIMSVELKAIVEALAYLESIEANNVVILTDSKSALQHIARCTSTYRGTPTAYVIVDLMRKLKSKNKNVMLQWIPSHIGIEGNEVADRLAKEAASEGVALHAVPFYTETLVQVRRFCVGIWKEFFDKRSQEKGIWYRTIQPEPLQSPWITQCSLTRQDLVIAMRLRSGHIPTNKFKHIVGKAVSPNCTDCGVVEDVYHILMECVRGEPLRAAFNTGLCNVVLADPESEQAKLLYKCYKMCLGT